jgi:hypothetical protein
MKLALLSLAALLGVGCTAPAGHAPDAAPRSAGAAIPGRPRSFVVQGRLTIAGNASSPASAQQNFLLRVDPAARTVVVGGPGSAVRVQLDSADGITFEARGLSVTLADEGPCEAATLSYQRFSFTVRGDRLEGTGTGKLSAHSGDALYSQVATLAFTGVPDLEPPTFGADWKEVDPLGNLILPASEPLPPGSTARLVDPAGEAPEVVLDPLAEAEAGDLVVGFLKDPATALVPGITYSLQVSPPSDLAGNAATSTTRVTTAAAALLLSPANLGFEETPPASSLGGAAVFDATLLPPISGQRSLFVGWPVPEGARVAPSPPGPWGERFKVRLGVPATAARLRLQARAVSSTGEQEVANLFSFRVGAPGGAITQAGSVDWRGPLLRQPLAEPPDSALYLGEVRTVEISLPAGHGPEVILEIRVSSAIWCGPQPPRARTALVVDDLRVD